MINTDTIIQNIIDHYKDFEWVSRSGLGTTKFQAIFNYEHNSHTKGYPYMYVNDPSGSYDTFTNQTLEGDITIVIAICAKWDVVGLTAEQKELSLSEQEEIQKTEAMTRLREAWNVFKADIVKHEVFDNIVSKHSWLPSFSFDDDNIDELSLFRKTCTITLKEYLKRY